MSSTLKKSDWKNSIFFDSVEDIKKLKNSEGPDLKVHGSGNMVQTLLKHDLVDELWLLIHPLTLGTGHKLFDNGTIPAAFSLVECKSTPSGVIAAHYKRAGEVKTGTMGG
jgi:dihydrofolate reductase